MALYVPCIIKYVSPVLTQDGMAVGNPQYKLKLTTPASSQRPGIEQTMAQVLWYDVPINQVLVLRLIPSNFFHPFGRYRAEFYQIGRSQPVDRQNWVVPYASKRRYYTAFYSGNAGYPLPFDLPIDYISSILINGGESFYVTDQKLIMSENPDRAREFVLEYNAGVLLSEMLYDEYAYQVF